MSFCYKMIISSGYDDHYKKKYRVSCKAISEEEEREHPLLDQIRVKEAIQGLRNYSVGFQSVGQ